MRPMRQLGEAIADVRDVALQLGVVVDTHLAADFGVGLLADGDFLRLAHERELALAGDGIGRASE